MARSDRVGERSDTTTRLKPMPVAAYVYTGWHPIPERDRSFGPGFTEWDLVRACRPRFPGHEQPRLPALGTYDDRDPDAVATRIRLARAHGVDAFVYGVFWCRGKRVFEQGLDRGLLGSEEGRRTPFACMWANRMPRRVLPVRRADLPVVDPARRVDSDVADFVAFVRMLATEYFCRDNYLTLDGRSYLSIFDSTFFVRELGVEGARAAVSAAREWLAANGHADLHLAAIDPAAETMPDLEAIGFDSVTHYVFLPDWRGPRLQDYGERARARAAEMDHYAVATGLPYMPSVATGWDASPRGADFGTARPDKYPWSPVVTGSNPARFRDALAGALRRRAPLTFVASLNEWSEGHYLEPDERWGTGWLEAVADAKAEAGDTGLGGSARVSR